jgi:glucokinase
MQSDQNTFEIDGCVLALDVGGSFIKSGLADATGLAAEFAPVPVDAAADARSIIRAFAEVVGAGMSAAAGKINAIGIAFPGPFDYARGVSLMTRKFAGINGVELSSALRETLPEIAAVPIRFRHDANAFLSGELWRGAGQGLRRAVGVTLGTGIGVSCSVGGRFINNALGSPAPEVSVWSRPYKGGIVEDVISTAGLVARYRLSHLNYDPADGVKGIAGAAKGDDPEAVRLFAELGTDLGAVLLPLCERFRPEKIIFGGQISKDFALFEETLKSELCRAAQPPEAVMGKLGNRAALFGAACG